MKPELNTTSVCIVQPTVASVSETFIKAHAEWLPGAITVLHGRMPHLNGQSVVKRTWPRRLFRKCLRLAGGTTVESETTAAFVRAFGLVHPQVVLAEYGPTGAWVREACRRCQIPLVVHFHGFDASERKILEEYKSGYRALFCDAARLIVVSETMRATLLSLGAPADKVLYNPYGVDCQFFCGAVPGNSAPTLLAVGRFVEKKAPQLTISAFAEAHREHPEAQLRMIGDGPLLAMCRNLASELGLEKAVHFLGPQPPSVVCQEMRHARAFVQHSLEAPSGDCEGLPVGILEAGASGLPVVATRHAGIPEAVDHGETGFLVEEGDVHAMGNRMLQLLKEPELADRLGKNARQRICAIFNKDRSTARLWSILTSCIRPADDDWRRRSTMEHIEPLNPHFPDDLAHPDPRVAPHS